MTWSVHQHWDPLKVCVVGRSYPPEFYSWISNPVHRTLFEKIAIETEEDLQSLIAILKKFNVEVLRPQLPEIVLNNDQYVKPPLSPRDYTAMIGNTFYHNDATFISKDFCEIYNQIRDPQWPDCNSFNDFQHLPENIKLECTTVHQLCKHLKPHRLEHYGKGCLDTIISAVQQQGNLVVRNRFKKSTNDILNGASVHRLGQQLIFGTTAGSVVDHSFLTLINSEFSNTCNQVFDSQGHLDGVFFPVAPGLVVSTEAADNIRHLFPDWDIVCVNNAEPNHNSSEKWYINDGHDPELAHLVNFKLNGWTGNSAETVFDVNVLVIDSQNIIVSNYNETLFKEYQKRGITPHLVNLRHRLLWDGGVHCLTSDLSRSTV